MPLELERYLLAAGEFGLGYAAVYGPPTRPMGMADFLRFRFMQERLRLISTEEGRQHLRELSGLSRAIAAERAAERAAGDGAPPETPPPFDPARMTPEEIRAYVQRYG